MPKKQTRKQLQARRKNIKKAQKKWRSMTHRARQIAMPNKKRRRKRKCKK